MNGEISPASFMRRSDSIALVVAVLIALAIGFATYIAIGNQMVSDNMETFE